VSAVVSPRPSGLAVPVSATHAHRLAAWCAGISLAMLPLLRPGGPKNTAPIDLLMLVAIVAVVLWASVDHPLLFAPYAAPVLLLAVAGLLGGVFGGFPTTSALAVVGDLWLFLWCLAIVNVARTPGSMRTVMRAWALAAVVWSGLLVAAVVGGIDVLAGHTYGSSRAALTFDQPNQAGAYFLLSFWVVAAVPFSTRARKVAACGVVLLAMLLTGSMGSMLGVAAGAGAVLVVRAAQRHGVVGAIAVALVCLLAASGAVLLARSGAVLQRAQESDVTLIRDSLGRSDRSSTGRLERFGEIWAFRDDIGFFGVGAGATKPFLAAHLATQAKEAHNDYVATLAERGLFGGIGLVLLVGAIVWRAIALALSPIRAGFERALAAPLALVGGAVALLANALTHEILHYRQTWGFLAILAAAFLFARGERSPHRREVAA